MLYRYALAIACAADGDEMPIKKPEFDEGRTQAGVKFYRALLNKSNFC